MDISHLPEIAHLGYLVKDIQQSVLAFKALYQIEQDPLIYDFTPMRNWDHGHEVPGCHLRICLLEIQPGLKAELIEHVSGDVEHGRWVARTGGGLHHIAYRTTEYDRHRQYVLNLGGTPIFEQETEDELQGYRRCTYFQMPGDGGVIEILEAAYFRK